MRMTDMQLTKALASKRVDRLTRDDIKTLIEWYVRTRGRRALEIDRRRLSRIPVRVETWLRHPNRYDIPGVDTPPTRQEGSIVSRRLPAKTKSVAPKTDYYEKTLLHIDNMIETGYDVKNIVEILREKTSYPALIRLVVKANELGNKISNLARNAVERALIEKLYNDLVSGRHDILLEIVLGSRDVLRRNVPGLEMFKWTLAQSLGSIDVVARKIVNDPVLLYKVYETLGENNFLKMIEKMKTEHIETLYNILNKKHKEVVGKKTLLQPHERWIIEKWPVLKKAVEEMLDQKRG